MGIQLSVNRSGAWRLYDLWGATFKSGTIAGFDGSIWHNLKVIFQGTNLKAFVDNSSIASVVNTVRASGVAFLGTCNHPANLFDNLKVVPVGYVASDHLVPMAVTLHPQLLVQKRADNRFSITYACRGDAGVKIDIYDMLGNKIRALTSGTRGQGSYTVDWNGLSDAGCMVAPGSYVVKFSAAGNCAGQCLLINPGRRGASAIVQGAERFNK